LFCILETTNNVYIPGTDTCYLHERKKERKTERKKAVNKTSLIDSNLHYICCYSDIPFNANT